MLRKDRKIFEKLPFEIKDTEYEDIRNKGGKKNVEIGPKKYIQSAEYKERGLDIYNFEARPDDVYLIGHPRSGTTLHSEMVWLIGNDLNYEEAAKILLVHRFPHIDYMRKEVQKTVANTKEACEEYITFEGLARRECRRFIKSHLPIGLMSPSIFDVGAKVIYCARDPRDTLVSLYNIMFFFNYVNEHYSFRQYFDDVKKDAFRGCPYFEHIKEAWAKKDDANVLFLFYEDTLKDKKKTILKVANFLGKTLTNDQLVKLEDHLSIDNFKKNKSVNLNNLIEIGIGGNHNQEFIRTGKAGGWRDYFQGEMEKEVDEWIKSNLADTDLRFPET